ncbi:MAG: carbohydrate binding family 9 domain-containing protein [bacterium]|nr:MAG: carbohydrate binding family 9 domain-containing protein [bacterium]
MKSIFLIFAIIFTCFVNTFSSEPPQPVSTPDRVTEDFAPNPLLSLQPISLTEEVIIDGKVENAWLESAHFENFTEYQPTENRQPIVATEGYVVYDVDNIYISFICHDPDISQLRANLTDRDKIFEDDWVCVSIDPDEDYQKAYQFYANARGIQGDKLWQSNGTEDESFDLIWQSEAKILEDSWSVEMKIPFESLRFPNREKQSWSVHFTRNYPRDNEYIFSWMPISMNKYSFMGQAGKLEFQIPKKNSKNRTFEILPYTIATQQNYREENPGSPNLGTWKLNRPEGRAGFGIKYGLSSNFITDFTYNPDFSQIESDAGQISINYPFALFYDEKRPFFQEGSDIYAVDQYTRGIVLDQFVNLFYSRSINNPLVAGKISGKFGKLGVGYTTAYDQNTPYVIPFEESSAVLPTDKKSYNNIFRAKYDIGNQSSIGFFTSDRRLKTKGSNSVASIDANIRLSEQYKLLAMATITYTQESDDPELSQMIGSGTFKIGDENKTAAFDGESFYGYLLRTKIQRESLHWLYAFAYQDFSPGFRADNGFITTISYRNFESSVSYTFRYDDHQLFTFIEPRVTCWRKYGYNNIVRDTGIVPSINIRFRKQTNLYISGWLFNHENLRGKQFGDAREVWMSLSTNMLKTISGSLYTKIGKEINRRGVEGDPHNPFEIVPTFRFNVNVTLKPTPKLINSVVYQNFSLWKRFQSGKIMSQKILRNSFSYQYNKKMFIRLILEYNIVDFYNSYISEMVHQKYFTFDPLISYKLNAFSVFYLGAHFGARTNFYLDWNDIRLNDQSVYLKFQYLFRS